MTAPTGNVPARVFMSYRRDDTAYPSAWLYERLASHFGRKQVFKDIDSIELGDDFVEEITAAVGSCDVLLALIGARWLTITDQDGRRRVDNPDDFVRLEIEAALARDVRIIPVLVEGARMPHADELPASLAKLVRRQALELSPSRFDLDTQRLLRVLDRTVEAQQTLQEADRKAREDAEQRQAREDAERRQARVEADRKAREDAERRQARVEADRKGAALTATLQTSLGRIVVRLFPDHAPKTVRNFVELAEGGRQWTDPGTGQATTGKLYDGTIFHRVIPDFMIQGGDPLGSGRGGPGYKFGDEIHSDFVFDRPYLLAMANAGPGTNGSQFFITTGAHTLAERQAHHLRRGHRGRRCGRCD